MYSTSIVLLNNGLQHLVDWCSWSKTFSWLNSNVLCNANVFVNFCFFLPSCMAFLGRRYTQRSFLKTSEHLMLCMALDLNRPFIGCMAMEIINFQMDLPLILWDVYISAAIGAIMVEWKVHICCSSCWVGCLLVVGFVVGWVEILYNSKQHFAHWVGSPFFP